MSYLHQLSLFIRSSLDISLWHALHTNTNLSRSSSVYSLGVIWWSWGVLVLHPQHAHFPSQSFSKVLRHCFHWDDCLYLSLASFPFILFILKQKTLWIYLSWLNWGINGFMFLWFKESSISHYKCTPVFAFTFVNVFSPYIIWNVYLVVL